MLTPKTCIDFKFFGHFGNLVNHIKGSGGEHMIFLTVETSQNKLNHPNEICKTLKNLERAQNILPASKMKFRYSNFFGLGIFFRIKKV